MLQAVATVMQWQPFTISGRVSRELLTFSYEMQRKWVQSMHMNRASADTRHTER